MLRPALRCAASLTLALSAAAQGSDACSQAEDLGSMLGSFPFDTAAAGDTGTAATTSPESACDLSDDVWFRWTAPMALDGHIVRFDDCGTASFDTELGLYEGADCATTTHVVCVDDGCAGLTSEIEHPVQGGSTYLIQVGYWSPAGGTHGQGMLSISDLGPEPCDLMMDDAFEPNDDCSTPFVGLATGSHQDLFLSDTDPDSYEFAVAAGQSLILSWFSGFGGIADVDANLFDASCTLIRNFDTNRLRYSPGANPATVVVELYLDPLSARPCAEYDLHVSLVADTCSGLPDDGLEENDDCASALALHAGVRPDLFVWKQDPDYYTVEVDDGDTLTVDVLFQHSQADIDAFLYASEAACAAAPPGSPAGALVAGFSGDDNETLVYTNTSGTTQTYHLRVEVFPDAAGECTTYTLGIDGTVGGLGTPYCSVNANSSGTSATLRADGSPTLADQDLTLTARGVVPGSPGLYFFGPMSIEVPFGDGFRCIGGATTRIQPPVAADATGTSLRSLDFSAPYASDLNAGETFFQLWYRDPMAGMAGYNLSLGLSVELR